MKLETQKFAKILYKLNTLSKKIEIQSKFMILKMNDKKNIINPFEPANEVFRNSLKFVYFQT